jgi:hypothetical protein
MRVWVVVFDYGLNGSEVAGAYATEALAKAAAPVLETSLDDHPYARRTATGYGGYDITELEVQQ